MICEICPHFCDIAEGETGFCGARTTQDNKLVPLAYGKITSYALDPIEKKPLYRFHPGSMIFSIGSYGCNFRCSFCQNHSISMNQPSKVETLMPEQIAKLAKKLTADGNIGVAYTYNEPLINYEFIIDCAKAVHETGLKNVLVTNGYINPAPLKKLLPYIDACNIDLKGYTEDFYASIKGRLATVKETIAQAAQHAHVEVTTLIIPGENDTGDEIDALAQFIANINPTIPLHLSRFFPRYQMTGKQATLRESIYKLKTVAEKHLQYVYVGNMG